MKYTKKLTFLYKTFLTLVSILIGVAYSNDCFISFDYVVAKRGLISP